MIDRARISKLLKFDPLQAAEDLTGRSSHDDPETQGVGFLMAIEHDRLKREAMLDSGDTSFSCSMNLYDRVVRQLGFSLVLQLPFHSQKWGCDDEFRVYARQDGLILHTDTFGGKDRNSAGLVYNWRPTDQWLEQKEPYVTSSGHWHEDSMVYIGTHDVREAIRHKIDLLGQHGSFVTPWIERPFLWLLHYDDSKRPGYDWKAITEERIRILPEWVRRMITPAR